MRVTDAYCVASLVSEAVVTGARFRGFGTAFGTLVYLLIERCQAAIGFVVRASKAVMAGPIGPDALDQLERSQVILADERTGGKRGKHG